jgi:hypothetical protein
MTQTVSPTNSDVLWSKIRMAEGRLHAASDLFWTHPDLPTLLPEFFVQLYAVMRGGLGLMALARDRAATMTTDPVAQTAATYLQAHMREEAEHDQWLLDDLATLGISSSQVLSATPCAGVVTLLGAQYFWLFHAHPVAIFGYLIVLEGYPPLAEQLQEIQVRTGLPSSAFRCLLAHAENDPHHIAMLNRTLDAMDLTEAQIRVVGLSALHTIDAVATIFEELIERRGWPVLRKDGSPVPVQACHA